MLLFATPWLGTFLRMERKLSWPLTDNGMAVIVHEQQGLEVVPLKTFYEISERNVQVCS